MSIAVAGSHFLLREGLVSLLSRKEGEQIAGAFQSIEEVVLINDFEASLLIVIEDGIHDKTELLKDIMKRFPAVLLVLIEWEMDNVCLKSLQEIGMKCIVSSGCMEDELFYAIESSLKGKKYYSEDVWNTLMDHANKKSRLQVAMNLTGSELEIVKLIAEGLTTKQIAARKHLSIHTVMTHRKNVFRKLGVTNVSELILHAIKSGWIDNIEYYI